jgi:tRNA 2-thiouridine synthesizing protein A
LTDSDFLELDARGLICPLPVLKARKSLRSLAPGGVMRVLATDPGAPKDFEHFCATTGTRLVSVENRPDHIRITLELPADSA